MNSVTFRELKTRPSAGYAFLYQYDNPCVFAYVMDKMCISYCGAWERDLRIQSNNIYFQLVNPMW